MLETITILVADHSGAGLGSPRPVLEAAGGRVLAGPDPATVVAAFASTGAAIASAIALQAAWNDRAASDGEAGRVAIAVGEAEREGGTYGGRPVADAGRLWAAARPGQILVSELVRLLGGEGSAYRFESLGPLDRRPGESPLVAVEVRWRPEDQAVSAPAIPLPRPLALEPPVAFVGRAPEWAALSSAWAAAGGGRAAVLVGGDAGTGKTRLVTELARDVHRDGAVVLYGGCSEQGEHPYQPFVEALDQALLALPTDARVTLVGGATTDLARLLPSLRLPDEAADGRDGDPEAQRYRLFEAVVDLLARLSADRPVLLVLDDLHDAQRPTIELLDHVLRSTRVPRLLVVATFRNAPADVGEALRELLPDLRRRPGVERLTLDGFDLHGARDYVAAMAGGRVDAVLEPVVTYLMDNTGGNAFLMGELWRHLVEMGRLERRRDRWVVGGPLAGLASPEAVREVVARRVDGLPERTRAVLSVAAVAGGAFDLEVVAVAADMDPGAALDALAPAIAARLVDDAGGDRLRFAHALVRRSVEDGLGPGERRRLHLAVGRAIEQLGRDDVDDLARHFIAALPLASADRAAQYARAAAAEAMHSTAHENAATVIAAVLPSVSAPGLRADLLLDQAQAEMRRANTSASLAACEDAAALARRIGDRERLRRAALVMQEATWRGNAHGGPAVVLLREVLAGEAAGDRRVSLLAGLSNALAFCGLDDDAFATAEEAIAAARRTDDPRLLLDALVCPLFIGWRPSTIGRQLEAAREALALAEAVDDDETVLGFLDKQMGLLLTAGDRSYRAVHDRHGQLARQLRQPLFQLMDLQMSCTRALNEGRLADAEAAATEAASWAPVLPHAAGGYGVQMFSIRREQGQLESVRAVVEAVAAGNEGPTWGPGLAALYAELDLTDQAVAVLDEFVADGSVAVARDSLWAGSLSYLADAAVATGHQDAAAVLYRELLPYRGYVVLLSGLACYGAADRYLGRLAEQAGRLGDVTDHLEAALRLDESMGSRTWTAHSQLALGQHLARRGRAADRNRAAVLLEAARVGALACGLVAVARRAGEARAELGGIDGGGPEQGGRAGPVLALTARELTVLRLVADGRTNRQIGDALHLSQHTVANHLRSILLKTGAANRTEAAMYAQRHGLLPR